MKKIYIPLFIILASCAPKAEVNSEELISKAKQEILDSEKAFNDMAQTSGVTDAFLAFAARDATLIRGAKAVVGYDSIKVYLEKPSPYQEVKLTWKPEFVDVSGSCDLGHTWGYYTFSAKDSLGNPLESKGIFRTVWKKQTDGSWKFVLD